MKKVFGILGVVILLAVAWVGFNEWNTTYRTSEAYAVVPATPDKVETKDQSGKKITDSNGVQMYSYNYTFDFVTKDGKHRTLSWEQSGANPTPLAPGSYVYGEVSQKRVNKGPNPISADKVPANIKAQLDK